MCRRRRRLGQSRTSTASALILLVALAACGDSGIEPAGAERLPAADPTSTTTTGTLPPATEPVGTGMWVLPEPPAGFAAVLAIDGNGQREVYYQRDEDRNDLFDAPIVLVVTFEDQSFVREFDHATPVDVHGLDAHRYQLWSDGDHYGTGVTWLDDQDRWVTLEWRAVPPPGDEIVDLARSTVAIDDAAWTEVLSQLGPDVVIEGNRP